MLFLISFSLASVCGGVNTCGTNSFGAQYFTSNLPIIVLSSRGAGPIPDTPRVLADMYVFYEPNKQGCYCADPSQPMQYAGVVNTEKRGQSSQGFPKNHYAVEIGDGVTPTAKLDLLGFPADTDFVFNGPYTDKALLRDWLAYKIYGDMGHYVSRMNFFELFYVTDRVAVDWNSLSESSYYYGVYVLAEEVKRGANRVDIDPLTSDPGDQIAPNVTGGYIFVRDRVQASRTMIYDTISIVYPRGDRVTSTQLSYIQNEVINAYNMFASIPPAGWRNYMHAGSFIDYMFAREVTMEVDSFRLSTHYHKPRNGKIVSGPLWDSNIALGNAGFPSYPGWTSQGFWHIHQVGAPWFNNMLYDAAYSCRALYRWQQLRATSMKFELYSAAVNATREYIREAATRNFVRWPILGIYVWPNNVVLGDWDLEVNYMANFLRDRITWMDQNMQTLPLTTPDCSDSMFQVVQYLTISEFRFSGVEFIEFYNTANFALALDEIYITDGIEYRFAAGETIAANSFIVVAGNRNAFINEYGSIPNLASGQFTKSLSNQGETITVADGYDLRVLYFTYSTSLPFPFSPLSSSCPDYTYELNAYTSITARDSSLSIGSSWSFSAAYKGTPGRAPDVPQPTQCPTFINPASPVDSAAGTILQWTHPSQLPCGYALYFGTSPSIGALVDVKLNTNYVVTSLQPSTTYYWAIEVADLNGLTPCTIQSFTTAAPPPTPTPVVAGCTPGAVRDCPIAGGNGTQTCSSSSLWDACTISSCNVNFHQSSGKCVPDNCAINSLRYCTIPNGLGIEYCSAYDWTPCAPYSCDVGFTPTTTDCVATSSCTVPAFGACVMPHGVGLVNCTNGMYDLECVASSCDSGYVINAGSCTLAQCSGTATQSCALPNSQTGVQQCSGGLWGVCAAVIPTTSNTAGTSAGTSGTSGTSPQSSNPSPQSSNPSNPSNSPSSSSSKPTKSDVDSAVVASLAVFLALI